LSQPDSTTQIEPTDPWLIEFLRDRDQPCPLCRYNLRDLTSNRCPECGQMLQLLVEPREANQKFWIAICAPLLASAGVGLFLIGATIKRGISMVLSSEEQIALPLAFAWFVLAIPQAIMVIVFRRRIVRAPWTIQLAVAVLMTIVSIMAFALFYGGM